MEQFDISEVDIMKVIRGTLKGLPSIWFYGTFKYMQDKSFQGFRNALLDRFEEPQIFERMIVKVAQIKYQGSGDVLAHVDRITTMLRRVQANEVTQIEMIKASVPEEMQRTISIVKPKTVGDMVNALKDAYPKHCPTSGEVERRQTQHTYQRSFNKVFQAMSAIQSSGGSEGQSNNMTSTNDGGEHKTEVEEEQLSERFQRQMNKYKDRRFGNRSNNNCYHCRQPGHFVDKCPMICSRDESIPCQGNAKYCPMSQRKN